MSRKSFVRLTGRLPQIILSDFPWVNQDKSSQVAIINNCINQISTVFETIQIPVFECSGQEINHDGEVTFILIKAYCQTIIQWTRVLSNDGKSLQNHYISDELEKMLKSNGLVCVYERYQRRMSLAFGMIALPENSPNYQLVQKDIMINVLKKAQTHAKLQWQFEMQEICQVCNKLDIHFQIDFNQKNLISVDQLQTVLQEVENENAPDILMLPKLLMHPQNSITSVESKKHYQNLVTTVASAISST